MIDGFFLMRISARKNANKGHQESIDFCCILTPSLCRLPGSITSPPSWKTWKTLCIHLLYLCSQKVGMKKRKKRNQIKTVFLLFSSLKFFSFFFATTFSFTIFQTKIFFPPTIYSRQLQRISFWLIYKIKVRRERKKRAKNFDEVEDTLKLEIFIIKWNA